MLLPLQAGYPPCKAAVSPHICVPNDTHRQNHVPMAPKAHLAMARIVIGALHGESKGLSLKQTRVIVGMVVGALVATGTVVAPAFGAAERTRGLRAAPTAVAQRLSGTFTPAAADPRLAAVMARGGLDATDFRFTPAEARHDKRAVTVAVRARSPMRASTDNDGRTGVSVAPTVGIAPIAYNLGVAVGWKKFAVSGSMTRIDLGLQPGSREAADVALTYSTGRASSRLVAAADRPIDGAAKLVEEAPSYSVDLSSSYSLTRNLELTAGVRYRSDRERLLRVQDDRRDSQAAYVGTAFRF